MHRKPEQCIDAGSACCPCRLALSGDCLVCSRLAGHDTCDCDWQGACIYNEYIQNGCRISRQRENRKYDIHKIIWYEKNLAVMQVKVPAGLAEKASFPGSYVFMKKPETEPIFYTPVSVMKADYESGTLDFLIQVSGPKSKMLAKADHQVEMRGIYHNGLIGADKLTGRESKRVLCLVRGVGIAPVINYSRWSGGKDHIDLVVDPEKMNVPLMEYCIEHSNVNSIKYMNLAEAASWPEEEQYDVIVLSASDYYQEIIYIDESKRVISNNHSMCCGEGICGACMVTDKSGRCYRMCKHK